jgi:hypothetical protein
MSLRFSVAAVVGGLRLACVFPDWTLKQLFRHVGRANRWAVQIISGPRRLSRRGIPTPPSNAGTGSHAIQGAAGTVVSPDLVWQGANRCRFVTWISTQRCSSRLEPSVPTESFAGPDHLARIQQEARKIVDSALNASN